MSVCTSVCLEQLGFHWKDLFYTGDFCYDFSTKFILGQNLTNITYAFRKDLLKFVIISGWIILSWRTPQRNV
jgi:hypothetical protein